MGIVRPSTFNLQPSTLATRRSALKGLAGILAAGIAPSLCAAVTGGYRRGLGMKIAAMGGEEALPYDAEVEYIQSTSTNGAFIRFPFVASGNLTIYTNFSFTFSRVNEGAMRVYGASDGWNKNSRVLRIQDVDSGYAWYGNLERRVVYNSADNEIVDSPTTISLNGDVLWTRSESSFSSNDKMRLFGIVYGTPVATTKIKYFKVHDGSDFILNAIPVRVGTAGAMYDVISKTIFANSSTTGSITPGPDKT